jgi:hypothetical protein
MILEWRLINLTKFLLSHPLQKKPKHPLYAARKTAIEQQAGSSHLLE